MSEENGSEKPEVRDFISGTLPFLNIKFKFGGRELFSIVVLTILAAVIWFRFDIHEVENSKRFDAIAKHMEDTVNHQKLQIQAQEAHTYVLSLTPVERARLNLRKPEKIREMERFQREDKR